MKKLLILLLLPLIILGQDLKLDHSYTGTAPFVVGDIITIKFNTLSDNNTDVYFITFDYQYNNKLLEKVDHTFKLPDNNSASKSLTHWDGYSFNPLTQYAGVAQSPSDLDFQYYQGWLNGGANSYSLNQDWSVERIVIQESSTPISHNETILEVRFRIKDRQSTNYSDYEEVTRLSWMKATDNTSTGNDNLYDVEGYNMKVNLDNQGDVTGVNAGQVTLRLNTPAKSQYATDYNFSIYAADGVNGKTGNALTSGTFDANGEVITGIDVLSIGEKYYLEIKAKDQATWLDDVLTVTDVYLIFQQAIAKANGNGGPGAGTSDSFDYPIQFLLGELNNTGNVDFDDSYHALGHIQGVDGLSQWFTSTTNGSKNVWGRVEQFGVSTNDYYFGQDFIFQPTDDTKTFDFAHAFIGDVDFSHSYTPTAGNSSTQTSQAFAARTMTSMALQTPIQSNLDIISELENGKVYVTINMTEEELVGAQFNIKYDDTILELEDAVFDTGNTMTNFATHKSSQSIVSIGSLDQSGEVTIKTGKAYTLVFKANETLQNTSGLVTFSFTEAVKKNGTKVKFTIQ